MSRNSERAKMNKRQKNTAILSYFAKQRKKESTEIEEHEQKTDSSRPTCSTAAPQSTEYDSAEKRINLVRPNRALDDIAKILPPNRSNKVNRIDLPKNAFRPVGDAAMAFDF